MMFFHNDLFNDLQNLRSDGILHPSEYIGVDLHEQSKSYNRYDEKQYGEEMIRVDDCSSHSVASCKNKTKADYFKVLIIYMYIVLSKITNYGYKNVIYTLNYAVD